MIKPIQSVSDIITNSSSEVFLMSEDAAKWFEDKDNYCIEVRYITTPDQLVSIWHSEVHEYLDFPNDFWRWKDDERKYYINENYVKISEKLPLAIVDIEDHMEYEEWIELRDEARGDCFTWWSNR